MERFSSQNFHSGVSHGPVLYTHAPSGGQYLAIFPALPRNLRVLTKDAKLALGGSRAARNRTNQLLEDRKLGPVRVESTQNRRQHMLASMTVLGVLA